MIIIDTFVTASSVQGAGLGCFANEDIKEGDVIWALNLVFDSLINHEDFLLLPECGKKYASTYCYWSPNFSMYSHLRCSNSCVAFIGVS
jgi:hypothetical protein